MIIITITNNKGGVGKTAMVKNLAFSLSQLKKKVLVIDMDNQNNLTFGYHDDSPFDLVELDQKNLESLANIKKQSNYDFVLIDTPPNFGDETVSSLLVSDYTLIPTTLSMNSIKGIERTYEAINTLKSKNPTLKSLGVVVNVYDLRDKRSESNFEILQESLGDKLFKTKIRVSSTIKNSDDDKLPVQMHETNFWNPKKSTEDFNNLAKEIIKKIQ
jgi:chromosome partitioning protein